MSAVRVAVLAALLLVTACGEAPRATPDGESSPTPLSAPAAEPAEYVWNEAPPPVVLHLPDKDVELKPWTSCWSGPPRPDGTSSAICSDGAPGLSGKLPRIEPAPRVPFSFGMPGWKFEGSLVTGPDDRPCRAKVYVERTDPRQFTLRTVPPPGDYRVDLFGRGEQGDVMVSFRYRVVTPDPDATAC